jgi:uncharacterized protein (DUF1778 family)
MKRIKERTLETLSIKIESDLKRFIIETSQIEHRSITNFVVNALYHYKEKINAKDTNKKS